MAELTDLLFSTIHGSHLYGMNHEGSDWDRFEVTTSASLRAKHSVDAELNVDTCRIGFDTFLVRVFEGSHQSVEALFSPHKTYYPAGERYRDMLENMRIGGSSVTRKYERTIKSFCYGDFKRRRHAVRLWQNLENIRAFGRFNPVMCEAQVDQANDLAERFEGTDLWNVMMG